MEVNPRLAGEEACICKRSALRTHCPYCGRANFYALKKKIERPHPQSGNITQVTLYRCRGCNKQFDDLQWRFNCEAPAPLRVQYETALKLEQDELFLRARTPGVKFNENEKRHFRKVTGMQYEQYRDMMANLEKKIQKAEFTGIATHHQKTGLKIVVDDKYAPTAKPQTPYDAHIVQCQTCMIADTEEQHCDAGKILFKLREQVQ
jgi:hypothetical protein